MSRPPCYNRPPRAAGMWVRNGLRRSDLKPIMRWVPAWSPDRCATHDGRGIGPKGENYAVANGYECDGCRWDPRPKAKPTVEKLRRLRLAAQLPAWMRRRFMVIN